jgi:hypothetical protein
MRRSAPSSARKKAHERDGCPIRQRPCERGASRAASNGVGRHSTEREILAQSCRFCRSVSGGVGLSDGFASRRSPVRSRYAPPANRGFSSSPAEIRRPLDAQTTFCSPKPALRHLVVDDSAERAGTNARRLIQRAFQRESAGCVSEASSPAADHAERAGRPWPCEVPSGPRPRRLSTAVVSHLSQECDSRHSVYRLYGAPVV